VPPYPEDAAAGERKGAKKQRPKRKDGDGS